MAPIISSPQTPPQTPSPSSTKSVKRYFFTPQQFLKAQRAWERKPSTPFAPRNESQKIWKRCEPKETNASAPKSRKQNEEKPAIKRLKADGVAMEEVDPKPYFTTKWDEGPDEKEHKKPGPKDNQSSTNSARVTSPSTGNRPSPVKTEIPQAKAKISDDLGESNNDFLRKDHDTELDKLAVKATSPMQPSFESMGSKDEYQPSNEKESLEETEHSQEELHIENQTVSEAEQNIPVPLESTKKGEDGFDRCTAEENCANEGVEQLDDHVTSSLNPTTVTDHPQEVTSLPEQEMSPRVESKEVNMDETDAESEKTNEEEEEHFDQASSPPRQTSTYSSSIKEASVLLPEPCPAGSTTEIAATLPLESDTNSMPASIEASKVISSIQVDDADYLHAFLTRAKAKKAATIILSPEKTADVALSPMTRSRSALTPLSANSPSPVKLQKLILKVDVEEEVTETLAETEVKNGSPYRRSARTRLPKPQKGPTVTPSTIPVRRSNGTEFVFLQRTEAQEVALATRSNTRRNKGEAVLPKVKLQALCENAPPSPIKSPRKKTRKAKGVAWDDQLAYFESHEEKMCSGDAAVSTKEESKPKTRKLRHLGAANGTPAPKKVMAESAMDPGTPLPSSRRRGKNRA